jgi:hypothetical protein
MRSPSIFIAGTRAGVSLDVTGSPVVSESIRNVMGSRGPNITADTVP